jgi:8-oxo-dGTP pyrophosphatase MutT (NUDIX family)
MINANAEILLFQKDVLQVRDNKPGITNPGLISSFGGHIEEGEEPIDAAIREINEETNLGLKKEQLVFYDKRRKTKEIHGEDWDVYYFGVNRIETKGLKVFEGSGFTVIHNLEELNNSNTTKLLKEVLTDYFEGFRKYLFYPAIDEQSRKRLYKEYYDKITANHHPSNLKRPVVLACTGLVAAGKSTITSALAGMADCVKVSSDEIRELFFVNGFNFADFRSFKNDILANLVAKRYNIFLDFNISTNQHVLDELINAGYKHFVIYANPPFDYIQNKILSGNMKHELTFFAKDEHVFKSLLTWKDEHIEVLPKLIQKYGIWYEADTSRSDLDAVMLDMQRKFKQELQQLQR